MILSNSFKATSISTLSQLLTIPPFPDSVVCKEFSVFDKANVRDEASAGLGFAGDATQDFNRCNWLDFPYKVKIQAGFTVTSPVLTILYLRFRRGLDLYSDAINGVFPRSRYVPLFTWSEPVFITPKLVSTYWYFEFELDQANCNSLALQLVRGSDFATQPTSRCLISIQWYYAPNMLY